MKEKVIVVCARVAGPLLFPDNEVGRCDVCNRRVEHRPHVPKPHILRCFRCATALIGPDDEIATTPRMIADALAILRKRQQ
jgi:hypothetical protein